MIIGAPGGKNCMGGIMGMCGVKDMVSGYLLLLIDQDRTVRDTMHILENQTKHQCYILIALDV